MSEDNDNENTLKSSRVRGSQYGSAGDQFKLPKLAAPPSRGRLLNRKESKAPTYLPSINDEQDDGKNFRHTEVIQISRSENDILKSENHSPRESYQLSVEDKLKIMMHSDQTNINQQIEIDSNSINDQLSDDLDFEQKILQNKQIIKMHRKMNQPMIEKKKAIEGLQRNNDIKPKYGKPQSNYERKMKQYHLSLENKYLQRKKQSLGIIKEKIQKQPLQRVRSKKTIPSMIQTPMNRQIKSNFGYGKFKNSAIAKSQAKEPQLPQNVPINGKRIGQQQPLSKSQRGQRRQHASIKQNHKTQQPSMQLKKVPRTSALFDNIQTFLQNPTAPDKHQKYYKELFKKLKQKSIPKLEQQLKEINQKLGANQNFDTKQTLQKQESNEQVLLTESPLERTVRDWKRVDINSKVSLKCKQSDFQKELEYISYLQQKNAASLKRFVDQQKLMLELKFNKRFTKSNVQGKPIIEPKSKAVVSEQYVEQQP